ncbi:hypothetical protein [Paenibacillus tepidiphilus]|uniref:hypothetical protein n=1 Tax=Paenibacillus tepidiphilus TaxID=2608683 RepID=UPI0013A584E0|nr:hypothetical protein [Paenibacillus tepidiphilus]
MHFPWHSKVMMDSPWVMQLVFVGWAFVGMIISGVRQRNGGKKSNPQAPESGPSQNRE